MKMNQRLMNQMADGGEGESSGETIGTGNDARLAFMNAINDRNDAERAEELADVNDDGTVTAFVAQEMSDEQQGAAEAELQNDEDGTTERELQRFTDEANGEDGQEDAQAGSEAAPKPNTHRIKVNGREMALTTEELIERAQKIEAADQYLIEAARLKREAEALSNPNLHSQAESPAADPVEERRALVRAIQMGTEEEAMAALERMQMLNRPQVDPEAITRTIDERLSFKEAASKFHSEYSDLMSDQQLKQMVLQRDQQLIAAGDNRPYLERWSSIGKEIRGWRDNLIKANQPAQAAPAQTQAQLLEAKRAKKAAASASLPRQADSKARPNGQDDEPAESLTDIIAAMAKARGGSQQLRS